MSDDEGDPELSNDQLNNICVQLGITRKDLLMGSEKLVVLGKDKKGTDKAYISSRFSSMKKPGNLQLEYWHTRSLVYKFTLLLVNESEPSEDNRQMENVLKRGMFMSTKPIVVTIKHDTITRENTEQLLIFMMRSADYFIDNGLLFLDAKPNNIGIVDTHDAWCGDDWNTNGYIWNDNGSNMCYVFDISNKPQQEYFRNAVKLIIICTMTTFEHFDTVMFVKHQTLYPTIDFARAVRLFIVGIDDIQKAEIRSYAYDRMKSVMVDGIERDLSPLTHELLFPQAIVRHYGANSNSIENFIHRLSFVGLFPVTNEEINLAKHEERNRLLKEIEIGKERKRIKVGGNAKSKKKIKKKKNKRKSKRKI